MKTAFKKVTAMLLALTIMLSSATIVFANAPTSQEKLDKLVELNAILGDGTGVNGSDTMTRYRSIVMMLRLQGLEDEMLAYDYVGKNTFTDAAGQSEYMQRLLGFMKNHPELGVVGYPDGTFKPLQAISAKEHAKIMLEVLGYKDGTDYSWNTVSQQATTVGLVANTSAIDANTKFVVLNLADFTYNALTISAKGKTLNLGEELGFVIVSTKLAISSASATSTKEITVKFNRAVADTSKVTFSATRDAVNVAFSKVTWNTAKTEAVLEVSYKLFEGDYVVTAKEDTTSMVSGTFEVEDEKIASVTFPSDYVVLANGDTEVSTEVIIKNQYGTDITDNYDETDINVVPSKATSVDLTDGIITLTHASKYVVDEKVTITVVDPETAVTSTKVLTVAAAVDVATIEIGNVATEEDSATIYVSDLTGTTDKYWVPITVKDQYGREITNLAALRTDLTIVSSNEAILTDTTADPNNDPLIGEVDDKPVVFLTAGAGVDDGNVTLTLVSKSGKSASKTITVLEDGKVDTFTLSKPEAVIKEGEAIVIPFSAVDQFGNVLTEAKDALSIATASGASIAFGPVGARTTITATNGTLAASVDYVNGNALVIKFTATSANDKAILVTSTPTAKVQTLTLTVEEAPVPTTITGIDSDFYLGVQAGEAQVLTYDLLKVIDQYGDEFELADGSLLTLVATDNTAKFAEAGTMAAAGVTFTAHATTTGTEKFTLELENAGGDVVDTYAFTMNNVPLEDISEFGIKDLEKIYTGTDYVNALADDYDQPIEIYGKEGTTEIFVDQGLLLTSTSSTIVIANNIIEGGDTVIDTEGEEKTATITASIAGDSGVINATKQVTYSSVAPKAVSLELKDTDDEVVADSTILEDAADIQDTAVLGTATEHRFYSEDQYGVEITSITYIVSNFKDANGDAIAASVTIDAAGTITVVDDGNVDVDDDFDAGDSFVITAVRNGIVKSVKVVLE